MARPLRSTRGAGLVAACALAAAAVTGCGDDNPRSNALRPPVPVVVTASISDRAVSISPDRLGAGPITLLITNQSNASQQVTLETTDTPGANTPGRRAVQTGPINPRETASVQAQVDQGSYTLSTGTEGIRPARLTVGPPRPSAQDQLGTP